MRRRVMLLTSNGAGLGHLTRSLAIQRRLDPSVDAVVFTLSQAAPIVRSLGVPTEYLYSAGYAGTEKRAWNTLYERRLTSLLRTYDPAVVMFDGTYPYRGLVNTIEQHPEQTWVWTRRAMWRHGRGERNLAFADHFDTVLEPGELAAAEDSGATVAFRDKAHVVAPIVFTRREELRSRAQASEAVGISPGGTNVLVQLGAGNIDDTRSTVGAVVRHLHELGASVTMPVSPIAHRQPALPSFVTTVAAYPLAPLLPAFDAVVAASGYNSFHELLHFRVPSLFLPNMETALDDQVARARWAQDNGVALCLEDATPEALGPALARLVDPEVRADLAARSRHLTTGNGADEVTRLISDLVTQAMPGRPVGA